MKPIKEILKQKPSLYVYCTIVALCIAMFVYSLVQLIMFSTGGSDAQYLNIVQIIFSIACILILSIYFAYIKFTKIKINEGLNIYFLLFLTVFLGVYPCFELYSSSIALGFFFAFLGLTLAVISISVFFHFSKTQNNQVKANPWFLVLFELAFATLFVAVIETLLYLISKGTDSYIIETVSDFVSQLAYAWIGMAVCAGLSALSLYRGKVLVNLCLIKYISD